jgi:hypothetical protein
LNSLFLFPFCYYLIIFILHYFHDEELLTAPSGLHRHRLAQAACSTTVELQRTLVSGQKKYAQEKSRKEVAKTQDFIGSIIGTEARKSRGPCCCAVLISSLTTWCTKLEQATSALEKE